MDVKALLKDLVCPDLSFSSPIWYHIGVTWCFGWLVISAAMSLPRTNSSRDVRQSLSPIRPGGERRKDPRVECSSSLTLLAGFPDRKIECWYR